MTTETLIYILLASLILVIILQIIQLSRKNNGIDTTLTERMYKMEQEMVKVAPQVREEFNHHRNEYHQLKTEINQSFRQSEQDVRTLIEKFELNAKGHSEQQTIQARQNRQDQQQSFTTFENKMTQNFKDQSEMQQSKLIEMMGRIDNIRQETEKKLDQIREVMEKKITQLQQDNNTKLEAMRATVDEKLNATLEKRFNESFKMISERLELVHKGLGEMQNLATNVGDLKKVMSNVKSRGVLGEYQLANLLEDLLTNDQYEKNVKTKPNSGALVEFAIKMPHGDIERKVLWLPVDSKFPKEDYERLQDAYESADSAAIDTLRKEFKTSILKNARDIKEKYIDPPNTTEYGIMFLPFESLYAEVLRIPGLFDQVQRDYRITITGPSTLSALLNSLQMGFRTLAIQKRSSEVWELLATITTEFGNFGILIDKAKKKLQEATNSIETASTKSRGITSRLKKVQQLPSDSGDEIKFIDPISEKLDTESE